MKTVSGDATMTNRFAWGAGCTVLGKGVHESHAFGMEFLATFLVVFVVFACYEKSKSDQNSYAAPFVIGLAYVAAIIVTVSNVFPRLTIGTAPRQQFWVGQIPPSISSPLPPFTFLSPFLSPPRLFSSLPLEVVPLSTAQP